MTIVGRRFMGLAVACVAVGLLWFPYAGYRDLESNVASLSVCEDNGLGAWRLILSMYADEHGGTLPTPQQLPALAVRYRREDSHFQLTCDTRAEYVWNPKVRRTTKDASQPLVWCGKPHGFRRKWRNVLFSDLTLRRVPEEQFRRLVAGAEKRQWERPSI